MEASVAGSSHVLVCGLGSLGQQCVAALKAFGMQISAIDLIQPKSWEVQNLPELLENLIIGDCRQPDILRQGKIEQCRAVLLVTNNERLNIEAAFAVRLLNPQVRLVLGHYAYAAALPTQFHQWEPEASIQAGDSIAYIEVMQGLDDLVEPTAVSASGKPKRTVRKLLRDLFEPLAKSDLRQIPAQFWQWLAQQQTKRVAILVGITVLLLVVLGTAILKAAHPQQSWLKALYVSSVMLLGSYDIVFGALSASDVAPLWMRFLNLSYMLAGTASIAVLYALLTESLLATKFALPSKRPRIPQQDHVVLIGLDHVGRQIATHLQKLRQPLVGVSDSILETGILPGMPLIVSDFRDALINVNLATARSVVVATDNEMANLEIGLMAHATNPDVALVIQTFEPDFSSNIDRLLPYAKVLCSYSLAAEAFAAAVFGDHILSLLRLNNQTVLVAEYDVQAEDGLHSLLLAEVAHGYGVVPILYQDKDHTQVATLLPSDDIKLEMSDRLVVLATVDGLHQIDQAEQRPRCWQVCVNATATQSTVFEGIRIITRITNCSLGTATEVMNQLPAVVPIPLYKHQALRLIRELSKIQTQSHLISFSPSACE